MKKIAYLATKPIGYQCLQTLIQQQQTLGYQVVAVLTKPNKQDNNKTNIATLAKANNIPLLNNLNNLLPLDIDILISVQYHKILEQKHINVAKQLAVNLHMAPLPEYRGCNQFSFAILDKAKTFGTTLHKITTKIDGGDILFEKRFPIPPNCWVKQLHQTTCQHSLQLFNQSLPHLINANYTPTPQSQYKNRSSNFHLRTEIEKIKQLNLSWSEEKINRHIRATYFPPFEPPYFLIQQQKIYIHPANFTNND